MRRNLASQLVLCALCLLTWGSARGLEPGERPDPFRQLREELPTPNAYRTASGAPGHAYWQQRVDYTIDVELDERERRLRGSERVTYHNNSPDTLRYLWVAIDPNIYSPESHSVLTQLSPELESQSYERLGKLLARPDFDGSAEITLVVDAEGAPLEHVIVDTMMRIDLDVPLASGRSTTFRIDWEYAINDSDEVGGRTGYEHFEEDGNDLFEIAQWFPRLAAYTDYAGWQNQQFLGRGEFTLEFGDYLVRITVPDDHVVAATGVLQNPEEVLEPAWRERLAQAETAETPVMIVTREEAEANEETEPVGTKTWVFQAADVRDFAFATSRKFLWDAVLHRVDGKPVWCMSYWPKEGEPLWSRYSTHSIVHTIDVYSKFTFTYPYPVAISVNGPVGGMEYPMICFNGPRPEKDGTYSERTKYGLISVIIHEVGHNWFPMIVNSDERQWTWMDEGLNTFVQYLAEQEWSEDYPSWRGEPAKITGYMASAEQMPIMTNSESILQFGANAYAKPATALNVLRETVMGRELFDFAFKEYANRWRFKRPEPADLFRTLEDASAVDLDWFWRGWFMTTGHVDLAITGLRRYTIDTRDPDVEKPRQRAERDAEPLTQAQRRNAELPKRVESYPELLDFYDRFDELDVTEKEREEFDKLIEKLEPEELAVLENDSNFYRVEIENESGLVMPVILAVHFEDGTSEEHRWPATIWRRDSERIAKLLVTPADKVIARLELDPHRETADVDLEDNHLPRKFGEERLRLREGRDRSGSNPMRDAQEAAEKAEAAAQAGEDAAAEPADPAAKGAEDDDSARSAPSEGEPAGEHAAPASTDGARGAGTQQTGDARKR